mmetsp:Transcript_72339/g.225559  ORF Transcript_72339/g.225559 Transcript_72339/m.225559 type:complete len:81 (-) Transcript_72339:1034-1276(-)
MDGEVCQGLCEPSEAEDAPKAPAKGIAVCPRASSADLSPGAAAAGTAGRDATAAPAAAADCAEVGRTSLAAGDGRCAASS